MEMGRLSLALLSVSLTIGLSGRPALAVNEGTVDDGTPAKHPNVGMVVVVMRHGEPIEPFPVGSVTLISPRVALTAAHITVESQRVFDLGLGVLSDARISFGVDPMDPSTWLEIESMWTHPDANFDVGFGAAVPNDVGAFILKEPVVGITPVTLAPVGFLDALKASGALREDAPITVVGYGAQRTPPPVHDVVNATLRRFGECVFGGFTKGWVTLLQNPMAGHGGGANNGDSGGGAFWTDPATGALTQIGVASTANDTSKNQYTRVDVPDVRAFIDAVLAASDDDDD
jgi:hypothetical protein